MKENTLNTLGFLAIGALLSACEPTYVFHPEENATAQIKGYQAAHYNIPPELPQGDVRIASFGISKIVPKTESGALGPENRAMHIRMVIANNGNSPWTVDIGRQEVDIRGLGRVRPAYVQADAGPLPVVKIAAGEKRTLDLFYPLPEGMQKMGKIPAFDALWRIQTPEREVAQRTPFERLRLEPLYASGPYGYGYPPYAPVYGSYGWYSPAWGAATIGSPGWYW